MSPNSTLRWRMQRSSAASVDCTANDTTSTATTNTEPSIQGADHVPSSASTGTGMVASNHSTSGINHGSLQDASMDKERKHTRTNFGEYQYYMSPDTKGSPQSSGLKGGAPTTSTPKRETISNTRQRRSPERKELPQSLRIPILPSPTGSDSERELPERVPSPFSEKRLQFFDDAVVTDQVPFDQVWNQQEFVLGDEQQREADTGSDRNPEDETDDNRSTRSETSKPFDEGLPGKVGTSDYSAFSAYSINSSSTTALQQTTMDSPLPPPPPPPPPPPGMPPSRHLRKKSATGSPLAGSSPRSPPIKMMSRIKPFTPTPPGSPNRGNLPNRRPSSPDGEEKKIDDQPVIQQREQETAGDVNDNVATDDDDDVPYEDVPYDDVPSDIPSDEDDSKLSNLSGRSKQRCSLATASKGTAAVDVGRKAEDLSSAASSTSRKGKGRGEHETDDNKSIDSLFDFQDQRSLSPHLGCLSPTSPLTTSPTSRSPPRSPGRWRKNAPTELTCHGGDDETSVDEQNVDVTKDLKARAQEAFATRRRFSPRKSSSQRSSSELPPLAVPGKSNSPRVVQTGVANGPASPLSQNTSPRSQPQQPQQPLPEQELPKQAATAAAAETPKTKNVVSFTATDTIHHFQHEYDMYSEQDESMSMGTLENEKSLGAEVEEAIKDIFMINALGACSPSPPKIRNSESRYEQRDSGNSSEDDTMSGTQSDAASSEVPKGQRRSPDADRSTREKVQQADQDDVFFEAMLSMVEGGVGALTAAFGFATGGAPPVPVIDKPTKPRSNRALPAAQQRGRSKERPEKPMSSPNPPTRNDYSDEDTMSSAIESEVPADERRMDQKAILKKQATQGLEDDPRLLELAKQAALCMHEVLGVHYDESQGVDIGDIKFVVVVLTLPLGLIFQEDYSGCWVTKVMPNGNAARSGQVEPGDQLAAIDSRSSIGMKVDDICDAIADASARCKQIELTFLRYVGPFQPLPSDGDPRSTGVKQRGGLDDVSRSSRRGSEELYPSIESTLVEDEDEEEDDDERPQSTHSVTRDSKAKRSQKLKSKKPGSFRKTFKWLSSRGKKRASKAE